MADSDAGAAPKPRRSPFGRRKRKGQDETVRRDDEWVDTLAVAPGAEAEAEEAGPDEVFDDDGRSPFDTTGFDESREQAVPADEEPSWSDEGPEALSGLGESGSHDEPTRHWSRRTDESVEEIEFFVDEILGSGNDPRRRRRALKARDVGLPEPRHEGFHDVAIEGIPNDVPIALPFPHDELRHARLVYETEGGYVIELERAVGGSDREIDRQYYTVSRVGQVEQVLDRVRTLDANTRAREEAAAPAPVAAAGPGEEPLPSDLPPVDEPEPRAEVPSTAPTGAPAPGGSSEGDWPEHVGSPYGDPPSDRQPPAEGAPAPASEESAQAETGPAGGAPHEGSDAPVPDGIGDAGDGEDVGGKRSKFGLGGLFGKKKGADNEDDDEDAGEDDSFADPPPAPEGADAGAPSEDDGNEDDGNEDDGNEDDGSSRRGFGGLFGRKKRNDGDEAAGDDAGDDEGADDPVEDEAAVPNGR